MPYTTFCVDKSLIDNTPRNNSNWEIYDESCSRLIIDVPFNNIKEIWKLAKVDVPIFDKNNLCHRIKYNIKNEYVISNHSDYCNLTIIIYKEKDDNLQDKFYIEGKLVTEELWDKKVNSYCALAMWNNTKKGPEHYGLITGNGIREVVCLFL